MLKPANHLKIISLYRDHDKALAHRDGKNCAIPACNRDSSILVTGTSGRIAALVTQTTPIAVPSDCLKTYSVC
jgi:hypothetical protein